MRRDRGLDRDIVTVKLGPVRLEYVNTKSWGKITQRAERSQELAAEAHLNLAKLPLLWDFGAGSWLYGRLAVRQTGCTADWLYGTLARAGQVVADAVTDVAFRLTADGSQSTIRFADVRSSCG